MTVIGLGFTKITMEKTGQLKGEIKINNNAGIKNIEKSEIDFGAKKQPALKVSFHFKATYEPNIAFILLEGELYWIDKEENIDELFKKWKKDKTVSQEVMTPILNQILSRSNVEALVLSRELNLPPPVPLPKVKLT